jgi:amidase
VTGYTEVVNLLDYSAAVIPVTTADKDVDVIDPNHVPLNDLDGKNWAWCKQKSGSDDWEN